MKHNYTPNMLVKLIYGDSDLFETLELEDSMEHDSDLKAMYLAMKNGFKRLPKVSLTPSNTALDNILFYSQVTTLDSQPMS